MPSPLDKPRAKQNAQGFLGVNLRKDRVTLADEEIARAINADLHERPGTLVLRRGRRRLFGTALADLAIRRLARVNSIRYAVAGRSVYRDQVKIIDGLLSADLFTTMTSFRPLADTATWVFIADAAVMRKDDGTRLVPWGVEAPDVMEGGGLPVLALGGMGLGLTGDYRAGYTFLRHVGDAIASESNATEDEDEDGEPVVIALTDDRLALSDMRDAPDEQVTGIGIYRTVAGGTLLLLDSRERFPTAETTFGVTHGWEVTASPGGTAADGLQLHWSLDKGTRRASQGWEPEAGAGLRFIGGASASGISMTLPTHAAGDLLVVFAYQDESTGAPSVPAGWSTWGTGSGANLNSSVGGYKVATSDSETSGDWAGAKGLICQVYRGQRVAGAIGGVGDTGSSGTSITYPALTMTDAGGTSLIAGFAGHRSNNTRLEDAPVGMVNRATLVILSPTQCEIAGHDSDEPRSSWPNTVIAVGGSGAGWRARTLEIRAEPTLADTVGDSEDVNGFRATSLWEVLDATLITTQTKRWAYASLIADSALGSQAPTEAAGPPLASWVAEFQGHLFLTRVVDNAHHLRWSERFAPESWPEDNLLEIGSPDDPIQCAVPVAGLLGVFTLNTKYRVTGNALSGFAHQEALSHRGTPAPLAVIASEFGLVFPSHDGIWRTNLLSNDEELSVEIAPLFNGETVNDMPPINWTAVQTFSSVYRKGRYYFAYASGSATEPDTIAVLSRTTGKWYFFDHPARCLAREEGVDEALVAGFTDGFVYMLEEGEHDAGEDIALDCETKDYFGTELDVRKLFLWGRVDADVPSDTTLHVDMYVNDTLKRTATVSGTRTRILLSFPAGSQGYTWRMGFRYTGQARVRIYGASAIWMPLETS